MKKILSGLLLFFLCACGGQRGNADVEQSLTVAKVKITNSVLPELLYGDGEDFAVKSELIKGELLTDTMVLHSPIKWLEAIHPQADNVCLTLYDGPFGIRSHTDSAYAYYKNIFKTPLNDSTDLSAELYVGFFDNDTSSTSVFCDRVNFYVMRDTIRTINIPEDAGGFTSEGMTFRITGDNVSSVEASYSMHYTACVSERKYERSDCWSAVCDFVTEELPLSVEDCSYTLPVVGALEISAADWAKMEGLRPDAISKWEGWTGQTMDTTNLVYLFELEHFVINLSVTYTNGFVHNFCHVALSDYVEP